MKIAVAWFVRMRHKDVPDADRTSHEKWLLEDHQQLEAYLSVEHAWTELDGIEDWANEELRLLNADQATPMPVYRSWITPLAFAASLVLAIGLVFFLQFEKSDSRFETNRSEQRRLVLEDGSRLSLNGGSSVDVRFTDNLREIQLRDGEGLFDVSSDHARPFVVRTGKSDVVAVGTRFVVYRHDEEVTVTVIEGRVAIVPARTPIDEVRSMLANPKQDAPADFVFLEADAQAKVDHEGDLMSIATVNAVDVTAWSEGKLIFRDTPLRDVVREISRYVPEQVRVDGDVSDYPVTGIIQIREAETMIDLLSQVAPVVAVKESGNSIVLHKNPQVP